MTSPAELEDDPTKPPEALGHARLTDQLEQALANLRQTGEAQAGDTEGIEPAIEDVATLAAELGSRNETVQARAEETRKRAEAAEQALAEEKRRLEKLWAAYKEQERELEDARQGKREAREALHAERERVDDLEEDLEAREASRERARQEKARLQEQLEQREQRIEELEPFQAFEAEVETLEAELAEERMRLAKLYAVFEEVEADRDQLRERVQAWEAWAQEHGEALDVLAEAAGQVPDPVEDPST